MIGRPQGRILVHHLSLHIAVDPGCAPVDHPLYLVVPGRVEHVDGAPGVDGLGVDRLLEDRVDIGHGRQVKHRVHPGHPHPQLFQIQQTPRIELDILPLRQDHVEHPHLDPPGYQAIHHVGPDKPGSTGYHDPHVLTSPWLVDYSWFSTFPRALSTWVVSASLMP